MNLNPRHLNALRTELSDVADALLDGQTLWLAEPGIGWVQTQMVNAARPRADYHIGEVCPASEYNEVVA